MILSPICLSLAQNSILLPLFLYVEMIHNQNELGLLEVLESTDAKNSLILLLYL